MSAALSSLVGPARYVSLRDAEENEVALVADPTALDTASRAVLDDWPLELPAAAS